MKRLIQGYLKDYAGNVMPNVPFYVYLANTTTQAKIYSSVTSTTPLAQPQATDSTGKFSFYTSDFDYGSSQTFDIYFQSPVPTTYPNITGEIVKTSYTIAEDTTVNYPLEVPYGVVFNIASGKTLTINSSFRAGLYQVFSGDGTVTFGSGSIKESYPEWFGAVADASTDSSTSFAKALQSFSVLELGNKTYKIHNVSVPSNSIIRNGTIVPGRHATYKFNLNTFKLNSVSNVRFENVNFESLTFEPPTGTPSYTELETCVDIANSTDIVFSNCQFINITSSGSTDGSTIEDNCRYGAVNGRYNSNVSFYNCRVNRCYPEGVELLRTSGKIVIDGFEMDDSAYSTYRTSTPFNIYSPSEDVEVCITNSKIKGNGGSPLNLYAKNIYINGLNVNGFGSLDISNEIGYSSPNSIQNVILKNVQLNFLNDGYQSTSVLRGLVIDFLNIPNTCFVELSNVTACGFRSVCISFYNIGGTVNMNNVALESVNLTTDGILLYCSHNTNLIANNVYLGDANGQYSIVVRNNSVAQLSNVYFAKSGKIFTYNNGILNMDNVKGSYTVLGNSTIMEIGAGDTTATGMFNSRVFVTLNNDSYCKLIFRYYYFRGYVFGNSDLSDSHSYFAMLGPNSITLIDSGANVEVLTSEPDGTKATAGKIGLYKNSISFWLENRSGHKASFVIDIRGMG